MYELFSNKARTEAAEKGEFYYFICRRTFSGAQFVL